MTFGLDRVRDLMLDALPAAAALSVALALAMLLCRQPVRRRALARAGMVALLLIIPARAWMPAGPVDLSQAVESLTRSMSGPRRPETDAGSVGGTRSGHFVGRSLAVAYLVGASCSLGWLALGFFGSGWLARRASAPSGSVLAIYRSLDFGGRYRPALRVSPRVRRPVLVGLVRQTILIPPRLERPEARDRLIVSLCHELAHARAGDPWFQIVGGLTQSVWFFLPPLWWIRAQMRLDQEYLADRSAADGLGTTAYATSLLDWAAHGAGAAGSAALPRSLPSAASAAESALGNSSLGNSALMRRMIMLLQCPFSIESRAPAWWAWGVSGVIATAALGISTVRFYQPRLANPSGTGSTAPAFSGTRLFRLSRMLVGTTPVGANGRCRPVLLPVVLPEEFQLRFELQAEPDGLAQSRVAGILLGSSLPAPAGTDGGGKVEIRRHSGSLTLRVDDTEVAIDPLRVEQVERLTFEPPPGQPIAIRNLSLRW